MDSSFDMIGIWSAKVVGVIGAHAPLKGGVRG